MTDLVAIAKIARPRGIKGEVIADLSTDFPERFDGLSSVTAVLRDGQHRELRIDVWRFQNDRILLKFAGIDSVESAETLRDAEVCIPESDAVELEEDEFYDWQLEGCVVETAEGESLGKVREVMRTGGTENLVIQGQGREYLIPFAEAICVTVDIDNKLIVVDPPEGLLEF